MPRYTEKQIADALRQTKGMVFLAARQLGCAPDTVRDRVAKSAKLQAVVEAESGTVIDTAELKLYQLIMDGDLGAVKYMLSTKGKERGYVERHQLEHSGKIDVTKLTDEQLDAIIDSEGKGRA